MRIINLTPHVINLLDVNGHVTRTIEPSGMVARVRDVPLQRFQASKIPFHIMQQENIEFLPPPKENTIYIVSQIIMRLVYGTRDDVFAPYHTTGGKKRKHGCFGLYRINHKDEGDISQGF